MCFRSSSLITTSAGVPRRPRVRLLGLRFCQSLVHGRDQLLVLQHLVGMCHPLFAQIADLFSDETFAEVKLLPARLNHESCSAPRPECVTASPAAIACAVGHGLTRPANSRSPKRLPTPVAPGVRYRRAPGGHTKSCSFHRLDR